MAQEAFCIHGPNRLLLNGLKNTIDTLFERNPFSPYMKRKAKEEIKYVISTNAQLVTFNNNNRLYTL